MSVLVIAEHHQGQLKSSTLHAISAAMQLGKDVTVLVCGYQVKAVAEKVSAISGVKKVLLADAKAYEYLIAENVAPLIASLGKNFSSIVAPATAFGKNILPHAAMLLNIAPISDVIQIISPDTFVRPIYAGNALATVQVSEPIKMMTVRMTAFPLAEIGEIKAPIEIVSEIYDSEKTQFVREEASQATRPELTSARVVISGGRALKSAENFKLLETLADLLGGAVGASRAAVDAGFVPNDYQVGQTGKVVAPELYIAIGISGAIQHLAGMKDSKVIVAINKDPDAPIFQVADYGVVGDLFEVVPQLCEEIKRSR